MAYRIHLIHWHAGEAEARAAYITGAGYAVDTGAPSGRTFLADLAASAPDAVLIDLSRLPSQGRDIGVLLRRQASTRCIPLLFVSGKEEKVARVRAVLPDAVFTTWEEILPDLAEAITNPIQEPIVPGSAFAAYAGKPLVDKLGFKPGMTVGLVNPPGNIKETLGKLPHELRLVEGISKDCNLLVWFVSSRSELNEQLAQILAAISDIPLWIAWPKKASGVQSDMAQQAVRAAGLSSGLVDYKVCSIDSTWSGLLFRRRK